MSMSFYLGDDGTMDTVIVCDECGREYRFNYNGMDDVNAETETSDADASAHYDEWVESCIEELENEHECGKDDE